MLQVTFAYALIIGSYVGCLGIGIQIGRDIQTEHSSPYDLLSSDEQESLYLGYKTMPTTVLVRIKTPEEITEATKDVSPSAIAVAFLRHEPCEIWLPTGMLIGYVPKYSRAGWLDKGDGDIFAHELLHCMRGAWHPQ